ncbi:conserved membrane protein of unknown function [Modestobacter italicus]|uniref:DUF7144 domain-containing protein n=1 Tax=Modestobacter italicus (strain DSM 44449 / CECT 9708 / BC 501) TaxID=2732864 RepID=I4EXU9_MODI5|nr:hypothetical protein [Modestobacter marinus]CCH88212.1 conserved membrane protein of unknown function [Modestobacter marinus]
MTDTSHRRSAVTGARYDDDAGTAWAGWVVFGAVMLIVMGLFQVIEGLVALFDDGFYAVSSSGLVVDVDYNTWGWVHIVLGLLAGLVGIGLLMGNLAARMAGVTIAFVSAVLHLLFASAYPLWSVIVITLDVLVIYAIVVHGRELKAR